MLAVLRHRTYRHLFMAQVIALVGSRRAALRQADRSAGRPQGAGKANRPRGPEDRCMGWRQE